MAGCQTKRQTGIEAEYIVEGAGVEAGMHACIYFLLCFVSAWLLVCLHASLSLWLLHIYQCVLMFAWLLVCVNLSVFLPAAHLSLCSHVCLAPCTVCVHASVSLCLLHIYHCVLMSAWLLICVHASVSLCVLHIYNCVLMSAFLLVQYVCRPLCLFACCTFIVVLLVSLYIHVYLSAGC
jgi:hypothetical protein